MINEFDKITLNGIEYQIEDLSEECKHIISQLTDIKNQAHQLEKSMEQLDVAYQGFTKMLEQSINKE